MPPDILFIDISRSLLVVSASFAMACDCVRAAAITLRYSRKPPRHLRNLKLWKYYGSKPEASVDGGAKCDLEVCLSGEP